LRIADQVDLAAVTIGSQARRSLALTGFGDGRWRPVRSVPDRLR
jgi:hypothetical protein